MPRCGESHGSLLRPVALIGVDVNFSVSIFAVTVDDVFTLECVLLERLVRSKPIGVDSERLLLAGCQQESDRRFVDAFAGTAYRWWTVL